MQPDHERYFFFNDTATTEIYTLSLHDALPICDQYDLVTALHVANWLTGVESQWWQRLTVLDQADRSEEHTSELQSLVNLVCRLLLEKKNHVTYLSTLHPIPSIRLATS